ncbi:hypothetical protein ACXIVK_35950 [Paraburkholderia caledonica]
MNKIARIAATLSASCLVAAHAAPPDNSTYSSPQRNSARCMGAYVIARSAAERLYQGDTLPQLIQRSDRGSELQPGDKEWRRGILMLTYAMMASPSLHGLKADQIAEAVRGQCQYALGVQWQ